MFFPEKIKNIRPDDYVLEIGPGSTPHPRSNVFLERTFENEKIAEEQRVFTPKLKTNKKIVYYDGGFFPFQDKEFDYVICSHVLERISDIEGFLEEVFRVAKKGYIEYPLIYYDYIYNIPENVTFLKLQQRILFYLPKPVTLLSGFSGVNRFFYESLIAGHTCLIDSLKHELFEGFEWSEPFKIKRAKKISDVCWKNIKINTPVNKRYSFISKAKAIGKSIFPGITAYNKNILPWITVGTRNQYNREVWLEETLKQIPAGSRILDAGAGERKYRRFCNHLDYVAQDFAQYDGKGDGAGLQTEKWDQSKLDIISDITSIPEPDASFDAIMCVEVFEHLPEPVKAIQEFARLLKPGGHLILTAPFCSLTHFSPYHFYTGFNRYFYETHLPENGFEIVDLQENGNYFAYLAQEVRRIPSMAERYARGRPGILEYSAMKLCLSMLGRFSKRDRGSSEMLHFGCQVLAVKK